MNTTHTRITKLIERKARRRKEEELWLPTTWMSSTLILGYNAYTIVTLHAEGFVDVGAFRELTDEEVDWTLSCWIFPLMPNIVDVTFPIRATVNVKALGFWVREKEYIRAAPVPDDFTIQVMDLYKRRMEEDKEYVEF
jgi:hypothetical protein